MARAEVERFFDAVTPLFHERVEEELGQTSLTQMAAIVEGLAFNQRTHAILVTYGPGQTTVMYSWRQSLTGEAEDPAVRRDEDDWQPAALEQIEMAAKHQLEEREMALFERQVAAMEKGVAALERIAGILGHEEEPRKL